MIAPADDQSKYPAPRGDVVEAGAILADFAEVICNFTREYAEAHGISLAATSIALQMADRAVSYQLQDFLKKQISQGA